MRNLKIQLMLVMSILTTGTVILTAGGVYVVAQASIQRNLDNAILQLAKTELASATDTGEVHVHDTEPWTLTVQGVPGYEKYVWIEDAQDRMVARTANVHPGTPVVGEEAYEGQARAGDTVFGTVQVEGRRVRAVFYPFTDSTGARYLGIVGVPENVVADSMASIGQVELLIGFTCVVLACAVAAVVSSGLSRPLVELTARVEEVGPGADGEFVPVDGPFVEVGVLSGAFGRLLKRVRETVADQARTIASQRRFVADASHELRTPVSNLQGTLEVALRQERDAVTYRELIATSLVECERMGRLVDDLLTLAKTDEGVFSVRLRREDMADLVRSRVANLAVAGIEVECQIKYGLFADIDAVRLGQALDNLTRNATTHAKSKIRVSAERDGDRVTIRVMNDGPELAPEDTIRIFERFTRLDHSRNRNTGGSGLGLAIAKAIVEAHRGQVSAQSEAGWTTFEIRLPAVG